MNTISIKPELIRWARERSGITTNMLLKWFPKLELWERGEAMPTLQQLEGLAKKTFTPLGYFFLPKPPEEKLSIPDYRTISNAPVQRLSPNLLETVQIMQRRQTWMRDFLIEQGEKPLIFIGSVKLSDNPNHVATKIRKDVGLNSNWANQQATWTDALQTLRSAVEEMGILTVFNGVVGNNTHRKLDVEDFRGFVLSDKYAPLIFINSTDAKAAQMFTFVHELVHLWLDCNGVFNFQAMQPADHDVERFCDRVAAECLVPAQELSTYWTEANQSDEPFQVLARRFKVSPLVCARRALDLGFIEKLSFIQFYQDYLSDERRKSAKRPPGGNFYATQNMRIGHRFFEAVICATKEGRLLYRDAYQLTGLSCQTFDKYAGLLEVRL
ncbi:ImmA/IrrE family metallo-endopeptidase [bacterium]|nr:ImmA/IrrE family metallo-endopeptidase [bacterium]